MSERHQVGHDAELDSIRAAINTLDVHAPPSLLEGVRPRLARRKRRRAMATSAAALVLVGATSAVAIAILTDTEPQRTSDYAAGSTSPSAAPSSDPAGPGDAGDAGGSGDTSVVPEGATCPLMTLGKGTSVKASLPCAVGAEILDVAIVPGRGDECAEVIYRLATDTPLNTAVVCVGDPRPDGLKLMKS